MHFDDTDIGFIHPVNRRAAVERERLKAAAMVSAGVPLQTLQPARNELMDDAVEPPDAPNGAGVVLALLLGPMLWLLSIQVFGLSPVLWFLLFSAVAVALFSFGSEEQPEQPTRVGRK